MKRILLFVAVLLVSTPVWAESLTITVNPMGRACYTPEEAEAEQGVRIHSELMVIGLNCQHMTPPGWQNFYLQYQGITRKHSSLISGYERTLINHYAQNGRPDATRALDDLRTTFANKVSTDAALMRPDIFCSKYAPRIPKVDKMSASEFRQWASNYQGQRLTEPMCQ